MNFKRVLALVLVFAMCLSMIPSYAFADFDEEYGLIDEADPAAQNETVPEGDVYIDDEPAEEPAVEPVVEPVAEDPAEPEKEQVIDLGELGESNAATFDANDYAASGSVGGEYATLNSAISQNKDNTVDLAKDVKESFTIDRAFTILGTTHTIEGNITIDAPGAVVTLANMTVKGTITLKAGELVMGEDSTGKTVTVDGPIIVEGGKLSISAGTFKSATTQVAVEGNVRGGTFTEGIITDILCADGFGLDTNKVVRSLGFVAQVGEGAGRARYLTLEAAVAAAGTNTIKLLNNITGQYELADGATINVEKNGKTIKVVPAAGENNSEVKDSTTGSVTTYTANPKVFEIKYELGGGENNADNPASFTYKTLPVTLKDPTKTGSKFEGWKLSTGTDTTSYNKNAQIPAETREAVTATASWTDIPYTLTFDGDGGKWKNNNGYLVVTSIPRKNMHYGDSILAVKPGKEPVKTGYQFLGWMYENGTVITENDTMPAASLTVKARWSRALAYNINYELDGGTNAEGNPATYTVEELPITLTAPTKEGYDFEYWTATFVDGTATGTDLKIPAGTTGNIDVAAKWKVKSYTLTVSGNGGTLGDGSTTWTVSKEFNANLGKNEWVDAKQDGYVFLGWEFEDGTPVTAESTMPAANTLVKAKWSKPLEYTIGYNMNDGVNPEENPTTFTAEDIPFTLKRPTKEGYTFQYWETADHATYTDLEVSSVGNKTFTANWEVNKHNVTFNANGGVWGANETTKTFDDKEYGTRVSTFIPVDPTRVGYKFMGWQYLTAETTVPDADVTFYAQWSKPLEYTITYNLEEDAVNPEANPKTYTVENTPIVLEHPTREGYTFQYWYVGTATYSDIAIDKTNLADYTVSAQWKINKYALTLNAGEGYFGTDTDQHTKVLNVKYDADLATTLKAEENKPSRDGYDFSGWSTEMRAGVPETMPASELTLYAVWEAKDVYILVNDGVNKITITSVKFGEPITEPVAPEKPGYSLEGWYALRGNVGKPPAGSDNETGITVNPYINQTMDAFAEDIYKALQGTLKDGIDVTPAMLKAIIGEVAIDKNITDFDTLDEALDKSNFELHAEFDINLNSYHNFVYLHADWEIETNDIIFDANGGTFEGGKTVITVKDVPYGTDTNAKKPTNDPTRPGYAFKGWTQADGSAMPTEMPNSDLNLIADWEILPVYVIINNGVDKMKIVKYNFGEPIEEPDLPDNPGHTFEGWYAIRGNVGKIDPDKYPTGVSVIPYIDEVMDDFAMDIYAALQKAVKPGIPLTDEMLKSIISGVGTPTDITDLDDKLDNSDFEMHATFPIVLKTECNFVYLHADWETNEHTVTIDPKGGSYNGSTDIQTKEVPYGTASDTFKPTTAPDDRNGYTFKGWTLKDGSAIPATMPDEDLYIIANWEAKKIAVTVYYGDSDTHIYAYDVDFGTPIEPPTVPEWEGHTFTNWNMKIGEAESTIAKFPINPKTYVEKVDIAGKWTTNNHALILDANGGTIRGEAKYTNPSVPYGTQLNLEKPERNGYEFKGWKLADGSDAPLTMPDNDVEAIAQWQARVVTVTVRLHDTNANSYTYQFYYGTTDIQAPAAPEYAGHTLDYWQVTIGNSTTVGAFPINLAEYVENVTLDAVWKVNKHFIRFYANGGEFNNGDTRVIENAVEFDVAIDSLLREAANNLKPREGYTFNKWWVVGTGEPAPTRMPDADLELYAEWKVNTHKFTLDANGGKFYTGEEKSVDPAVAYGTALDANNWGIPAKIGSTFAGWKVDNGTDVPATMPDQDLTLKAQWTANEYTIHYFANGGVFADGTGTQDVTPVTYGAVLSTATPTDEPKFEGHDFAGYVLVDGTKAPATMPASDLDLYASWTEHEYKVTYQVVASYTDIAKIINPVSGVEDEDGTYTFKLKYGETIPAAPDVNVDGYSYEWVERIDGYNYPETMPARNLVFTLKLNGLDVTYTFDVNGGTVKTSALGYKPEEDSHKDFVSYFRIVLNPETYESTYAKLLPTVKPVKEGYKFHGWIDEKGVHYDPNDFIINDDGEPHFKFESDDKTFTADWVVNSYEVTFKANKGVVINPNTGKEVTEYTQAVDFGTSPIPFPAEPTRDGYTFDGWDGMATGTDLKYPEIGYNYPATMPAYDIIFTATWSADEHSITFNSGDGEFLSADGLVVFDNPYVITGNTNDKIADIDMPPEPTLEGYTFKYWVDEFGYSYSTGTDTEKKLPARIPAEDLTLTAIYEINSYPVTFSGWGGQVLDPKYEEWAPVVIIPNVEYGTEITYPQDPVREGYTFNGWKDWAYGVTNPETMPDHALYFRADWEAEEHSITFNAGDGEFISRDGLVTFANPYVVTAYTDTPIRHLHPVNPTLEGYTFKYWLGDDGNIYNDSDRIRFNDVPVRMVPEDLVLTAVYDLNSVFVTYKPADGTMIHPTKLIATSSDVTVEYKVGDELILPAVTLDGYAFGGWVEETYGWNVPATVPDVKAVDGKRTLTLTAYWVGRDYTVTFDANYGTVKTVALAYDPNTHDDEVPSFTITYNFKDAAKVKAVLPTVIPVREGHTFHGWIDEAGKHYAFGDFANYEMEAKNKTFTAEWDVNSYKLTFNGDAGKLEDPNTGLGTNSNSHTYSQYVTYGETIPFPKDPVLEGYTFVGWDGTLEAIATDTTLRIKGVPAEHIGLNHPATMPARDVTFKAVYTADEHSISFNANDGVFKSSDGIMTFESPIVITKPTKTALSSADYAFGVEREGYTFKYWLGDDGKVYQPSLASLPDEMPAKDLTLTAVWEIKEIDVQFIPNNGIAVRPDNLLETSSNFTITYKFGDQLILPKITREGYSLKGWMNTYYGYNIPAYVPDYEEVSGLTPPMALKAMWEGEDYTLTFNGNGGLVPALILRADGSTISDTVTEYTAPINFGEYNNAEGSNNFKKLLPTSNPSAKGFTFLYWEDEDGIRYSWTDLQNNLWTKWYNDPKDMTFTAKWEYTKTNVTFDAKGGKLDNPYTGAKKIDSYVKQFVFGDTIEFPDDPVWEGHTFLGWFENGIAATSTTPARAGYGVYYPTVMAGEELYFIALWETNKYTYVFDANGGTMGTNGLDLNKLHTYTVAGYNGNHVDTVTAYSVTGEYSDINDIPHWSADEVPLPINGTVLRDGHVLVGWIDQEGHHYKADGTDLPGKFFLAKDMYFVAEWKIESFTAIFDGNFDPVLDPVTHLYVWDGDLIDPRTTLPAPSGWYGEEFTFDSEIRYPEDPVRKGYTFLGWQTRLEALTNPNNHPVAEEIGFTNPEKMPGRDVTFTAKWKVDTHTITLKANGGEFKDAIGVKFDTFVIEESYGTDLTNKWPAANPVREGYKLIGWSCSDGKNYYAPSSTFTTMPDKDIVLTAEWQIEKYKVHFIGNAVGVKLTNPTTGVETITTAATDYIWYYVNYGDPIPYPGIERTGYSAYAWVEDTYGYQQFETMPGHDLCFTAKWDSEGYSFTFDANGGTVKTNYLRVISTGTGDAVPSYTVVFDMEDADKTSDLTTSVIYKIAPIESPNRIGHTCMYWTDQDGKIYKTADFKNGAFILDWLKNPRDMEFTAQWKINEYIVKFDADSGKMDNPYTGEEGVSSYAHKFAFDADIEFPFDPVRVGYEFKGWFETASNTNISRAPYGYYYPTKMPADNLQFVAKWATIANTVVYNANGGTVIGADGEKHEVLTIEAKTNAPIYTPLIPPERYGYTFAGWYKHDNTPVRTWDALPTTMPAEGETFTARWVPKTITVYFYQTPGGTLIASATDVKFGEVFDIPAAALDPVKEGHTFEGWYTYTVNKHYVDLYDFSQPVDTEDDINLAAYWSINTYTVTYDANGGLVKGEEDFLEPYYTITDLYGASIHRPSEAPVREGFTFQGWFNEVTRELLATDTDLPKTMPAKNLILTAVWHANYNKVTYNANGGRFQLPTGTTTETVSMTVAYGDDIPVPDDPVYTGYVFMGWTPEIPEVMPNSALVFKALWQAKTWTVTFDVNGGANTVPSQVVQHDGHATEPRAAGMYRNGYTFSHWAVVNPNGTYDAAKAWTFKTDKVTRDMTLIAIWTGKEITIRWADRNVWMKDQKVQIGDYLVRPEYDDYFFQQLIRDGRREGYRLDPEHLWYPEPPEYVEQSMNGLLYQLNWIKQVQIIFLDEDGSMLKSMYIDEGTTLAQNPDAPNPQKEGYDLLWTVNGKTIDANTPITADGIATMKATYVEKPEEQTWAVTFNSNGGTEVKTQFIADGENAAEPADPEKDGFKFIGWTLDGETYDFKTPVTGDITLVAEYEEIPYVVGQLSMQLKNNFVLHYYVNDLREGTKPADYTVSFNGGAEKTLTRMDHNAFANVAAFGATQLLESIPVVVRYKGQIVFEDEISVRAYCDKVFDAYGHDHNVSLVGTCEAALNYGSAAQLYVGDDGVLVNYGEWYEYPAEEIPYAEIIKSAPITGITDGTASLQLGSSVSQFLYAYHSRKAKMSDYTFLVNGKEVEVVDTGSAYVARVMQIPVSNLDYENTLTVIYHEGQADQETFSMSASPTAYMYSSYEADSSSARGQLCYYLYNYYVATTLNDIR